VKNPFDLNKNHGGGINADRLAFLTEGRPKTFYQEIMVVHHSGLDGMEKHGHPYGARTSQSTRGDVCQLEMCVCIPKPHGSRIPFTFSA
jgi:hypothetical protein